MLWCLSVPNAMEEHTFTDDVALCRASTRDDAIKTFSKLYSYDFDKNPGYVKKVWFNDDGVAILTEY